MSFGGEDVTALSRRGWERLHGSAVGAVFQDPASYLNPALTVGGQLAEVLRVKLGLARAEAHRQRSSCSRRSACAARSGSSTRSRPSCPAACCSG